MSSFGFYGSNARPDELARQRHDLVGLAHCREEERQQEYAEERREREELHEDRQWADEDEYMAQLQREGDAEESRRYEAWLEDQHFRWIEEYESYVPCD